MLLYTREAMKRFTHAIAAHGGPATVARRLNVRRGVVLAYHNIVADHAPRCGEQSLHLRQSAFAEQLDLLSETHEIVSLATLIDGDSPATPQRPRAAITFDDAYAGAVTLGVAELTRRGLPATIFVAPGELGGRVLWWDLIATADDNGVPAARRRHALEQLAGQAHRILAWAHGAGLVRDLSCEEQITLRTATVEQLRQVAGHPGITLASHTWSHPNLARLDADALCGELRRPLAWLRATFPYAPLWLSYPYGSSTLGVELAVESEGYVAAFAVAGGYLPVARRRESPFALPRVNVPAHASADRFIALTAGLY